MAIALALGTAVLYGVANFLGPLLTRRHPLGAVLLVGQLAALACAAIGAAASGEAAPGGRGLALGLVAGLGNALGLVGFLRATELGPVSIAAPIGATGAVIPVLYGIVTGEPLGALEAAGLACALVGVVLAARRPAAGRAPATQAQDLRASVAFALASALGFGLLLVELPKASAEGRWWALLDARGAIVLAVATFVVATRRSARAPLRAVPRLALPGVLLLAGTALYLVASAHGRLSVVAVCASLNPAVTVALSLAVLGERTSRTQAVGVALALVGVVLIAA